VALLLPPAAAAWSNGGDSGDGFGTHDWLLLEASRQAAKQGAGWVVLQVALPRTDDPDTRFHDFYYHVYDVWGDSTYGDAPRKVAEYYRRALAARRAGDWTAASRYAGIMAHYYADICNPLHTDQTAAEDRMHSRYEDRVETLTDAVAEHRGWLSSDGYKAATSVAGSTRAAAAASHRYYGALVSHFNRAGMDSTVTSITRRSLNLAVNGLADLLVSIKKKVAGR
jgi:hypothetical protein